MVSKVNALNSGEERKKHPSFQKNFVKSIYSIDFFVLL